MKNKNILIIAGEPYSIFSEIFFKTFKKKKIKNIKNPIILIGSKKILLKQMLRLNYNFKINEILFNDINKVKINNKNLLNEYLLYEILFAPNTMKDFKKEHEKIKKSIEEIGFESSANIFSNSSSAKLCGKIGWVNENQLSKSIINNIQNLNLGEYSEPINVPSGNIILMIKDKREIKNKLSLEDELKKAISQETNKQFTQYSSIYFKKVELNTQIYEK